MSLWTEFPYREASELMKAFAADEYWRRGVVFSRALGSFSAHRFDADKQSQANDGFSEMIINNWRDLPPGSVEAAIDEVLKQAKNNTRPRYMTLPATGGETVNFDSVYQLRLFQLLPILQQLNKIKTERILQDEQSMGSLLSTYPKAPESLFPETQNRALKTIASPGSPSIVSTTPAPGLGRYDTLQAETKRIVASATDDPARALAQAEMLPVQVKLIRAYMPLRADALRGIAIASLKGKPAVATQAIGDMIDSARDLTEPSDQVFQLVEADRLSLELGDIDRAKSALESATSKANEAVKKDEDHDDPNLSFKGYWPSAVGWQGLLHIAARISPAYARKLTHDIWDDQIRVLATIALADEMAGARLARIPTMQRFAHGRFYHDAKLYASNDDH